MILAVSVVSGIQNFAKVGEISLLIYRSFLMLSILAYYQEVNLVFICLVTTLVCVICGNILSEICKKQYSVFLGSRFHMHGTHLMKCY